MPPLDTAYKAATAPRPGPGTAKSARAATAARSTRSSTRHIHARRASGRGADGSAVDSVTDEQDEPDKHSFSRHPRPLTSTLQSRTCGSGRGRRIHDYGTRFPRARKAL